MDNLYIPLVSLHTLISEVFMGLLDYLVGCPISFVPALTTAIHAGSSDQQGLVWYSKKKNPKHLLLLILITISIELQNTKISVKSTFMCVSEGLSRRFNC